METHSSILAWKILWREKPGELWPIGSQRVGHDWSNLAHTYAHTVVPTSQNYFENGMSYNTRQVLREVLAHSKYSINTSYYCYYYSSWFMYKWKHRFRGEQPNPLPSLGWEPLAAASRCLHQKVSFKVFCKPRQATSKVSETTTA